MRSAPEAVGRSSARHHREVPLAVALAVLIAVREEVAGSVALGDCVALVSLPLTWSAVKRMRAFTWVLVLACLAVAAGLTLSLVASDEFVVDGSIRRSLLVTAAALPAAVSAFVWASRRIGPDSTAAAFGAGMVLDNLSLLETTDNAWKYGLGAAVTVFATAMVQNAGRRFQVLVVAGLVVSFLAADARSTSGFLLLALVALMWQSVAAYLPVRDWSPTRLQFSQSFLLTGMTAAALVGVMAASLAGYLGEDAQTRTAAQTAASTNPILAARPELGASWALLSRHPLGYGAGVLPRYEDIRIAMDGMKALGYNPDNGYVENYMFGHGFELHSGLVDAWIALSVPGAALTVLAVLMPARSLWRNLGTLRLQLWLLVALLITTMNVAVGPLVVTVPFLSLVIGAALVDEAPRRSPTEPRISPAGRRSRTAGR